MHIVNDILLLLLSVLEHSLSEEARVAELHVVDEQVADLVDNGY